MRFLYKRGAGVKRRVVHYCEHDPRTGEPTMFPICGTAGLRFDTTANVPLGLRHCKRCIKKWAAS